MGFGPGNGSSSATNVVVVVVVVVRGVVVLDCQCTNALSFLNRSLLFTHINDNILHRATVADFLT